MGLFDRLFSKGGASAERAPASSGSLFDAAFQRRLETLSLVSRRAQRGERRGERRSKKRGSGVAFADHRPYVPGDDFRALDLGAYQRHGRLLVRLYEEEEDQSTFFLLDASASMGARGGRLFRRAVELTSALAYVSLTSLDRVSIHLLREDLAESLPATRGRSKIFRVLRFLEAQRPAGATDHERAVRSFVNLEKRRGLVVLLTDGFDPKNTVTALDLLRYRGFEIVVLSLVEPFSEDPELSGDLELVDAESGESLPVTPVLETLRRAAETENGRLLELDRYAKHYGIRHVVLDVSAPFDELTLLALRRGGLVG